MAEAWPASLAGFAVEHHARVGSTQDLARDRAAAGVERHVVVADQQVGGRGRNGRTWSSPLGSLSASIVLRRRFPQTLAPALSLIAGVAVAETVGLPSARLKWPNDVLIDDEKLAGLLLEATAEHVIIGFGANIATAPIAGATSLAAHGLGLDAPTLLEGVLQAVAAGARDLERADFAGWRERWLARAAWLGEPLRAHLGDRDLVGRHRGIDEQGALVLETAAGLERVMAGDVERLRLEV